MSNLPSQNASYSTKEYWDERYSGDDEQNYEWFGKSYAEDLKPVFDEIILQSRVKDDIKILMLGCGNSGLSADMYDDGYRRIVNIDYSSVVIGQMKKMNEEKRKGMEWREMDIRSLEFGDDSFDIAIDKGTMDAMLAPVTDVWNPQQELIDDCNKEVDEVLRVLKKPGGKLIYLTFGQPHFRKRYLTGERSGIKTELEIKQLGDSFHYYLYILTAVKDG